MTTDTDLRLNDVHEFVPRDEPEVEPRLPQGALRRLWHLQLLLEGASEVAQAAMDAHVRRRDAYQQAFAAACEDAGVTIPPGDNNVQIDWQSGEVRFEPR